MKAASREVAPCNVARRNISGDDQGKLKGVETRRGTVPADVFRSYRTNPLQQLSHAADNLDALDYTDCMKWIRLELAIFVWWFIKTTNNPRIMTSRERHLLLTAIRRSLVGTVLGLISGPVELEWMWSASPVVEIAGSVVFALGYVLLIIAMFPAGISSSIFGS
jgi:hypothetical protein